MTSCLINNAFEGKSTVDRKPVVQGDYRSRQHEVSFLENE